MIKTVPLDIPVCFLLGIVFVGLASAQIRAEQPGVFSRFVLGATGFCAWFGVTVCYFYLTYPDWMWSYWVDSTKLPLIPSFGLFWLSLTVAGFTGAVLCQELIKARKGWWAVAFGLYGLGMWAAIMGLTSDEYTHIGTWVSYHAGQATPLANHPMKGAMNIAAVAEAVPGLILAWMFVSEGRKLKGKPSQA